MIVFYHNNSKITDIVSSRNDDFTIVINNKIVFGLLYFSKKYKDEIIVWCHENQKDNLNSNEIEKLFHHKKLLLSYNTSSNNYFDTRLGYIEESIFVTVNKETRYPTWQMNSQVGSIHTSVLRAYENEIKIESNFDYFLNSFAKRAMSNGLFCYSEPKLLINNNQSTSDTSANLFELFKFTKQHYKKRWVLLLLFNIILFEKKFPLFPFLTSWFYKKRSFNPEALATFSLHSNKKIIEKGTIDVLIPTIGRKDYLLNVLNTLATQTYLPTNVIVIEQNPEANSETELDFITNKNWPFLIIHHFTNQTGACNARNIGIQLVESEFTFFADDDIFFDDDLIEKALHSIRETGNEIILMSCLLESQPLKKHAAIQFNFFGAGHAFVKSSCFKGLKFNMAYEYGFGEDDDFGMQLRNKGFDILYISSSKITHLKAPIGGFRTKPILKWSNEIIQPKPSPTVMLYRMIYHNIEQLYSYKITLFFKNLNVQFLYTPIHYIKTFQKRWDKSIYWANELKKNY